MRRLLAVCTTIFCLLAMPHLQAAQEEESGKDVVFLAYTFTPKDGMSAQFYQALKVHSEWREENGDPRQWYIGQMVTGEHSGSFMIRSENIGWADIDSYQFEGATGHFAKTVAPLIKDRHMMVMKVHTELHRQPPDMSYYSMVSLSKFKVNSGNIGSALELIGAFKDAMDASDADFYFDVASSEFGDYGPYIYIASFARNWADFEDDGDMGAMMVAHHGEEKAQEVFEKWEKTMSYKGSNLLNMMPELHVMPDNQ